MTLAVARVSMPAEAKRGEIVEIKALIRHAMETGYRFDAMGQPIPRHIIERFQVDYAGDEVFRMELTQGVSANPFVAFCTVATITADLLFTWTDDRGETTTVTRRLTVTP
jgi:sulfur-oxidizing protein SoxZ